MVLRNRRFLFFVVRPCLPEGVEGVVPQTTLPSVVLVMLAHRSVVCLVAADRLSFFPGAFDRGMG